MDVLRLIEEVKKRPILWDHKPDNKERPNLTAVWQQVAEIVGSDVKTCKGKWRNLRDAFRAEVRRTQRRAEKYKNVNKNDPRAKGTSKWAYFVPMSFIVKSQRPAVEASSSPTLSHINDDEYSQHSNDEPTTTATSAATAMIVNSSEDSNCISFASDYEIKEDPVHILSDDDDEEDCEVDIDEDMYHNDEEDQDMLFNEFQNLATPQAMRRLSHSISVANAAAEEKQQEQQHHGQQQQQHGQQQQQQHGQQQQQQQGQQQQQHGQQQQQQQGQQQQEQRQEQRQEQAADIKPASPVDANRIAFNSATITSEHPASSVPTTSTPPDIPATNCKCAKRVDEQVNFLEGLEREEEKLIKSTRQDITRCKDMLHVGDSDYNFLISFLPLMKKMSDLQNIHFRAKMSELLVHTMGMGPPGPNAVHTPTTLSQVIATPLSSFNPASICAAAQAQPQLFILQQAPANTVTSVTANPQSQQPIANAQVTTSSTNWS